MTSNVRPCTAVRDSDLDTALKVVPSAAEGIVYDFPLEVDPERSPLEGTLSHGGLVRRLLIIGREPEGRTVLPTRQLVLVRAQRQCRVARPLRMILMRDRRAEERHDAVAGVVADGALEAMHAVGEDFQGSARACGAIPRRRAARPARASPSRRRPRRSPACARPRARTSIAGSCRRGASGCRRGASARGCCLLLSSAARRTPRRTSRWAAAPRCAACVDARPAFRTELQRGGDLVRAARENQRAISRASRSA